MIRIDRIVAKTALKITRSYVVELSFSPELCAIGKADRLEFPENHIVLKQDPLEVEEAIGRLIEGGYFRMAGSYWGGFTFTISPYLLHRFAFFWDRFTKKFLGGYVLGIISGIIITVIGGMLLAYFRVKAGI